MAKEASYNDFKKIMVTDVRAKMLASKREPRQHIRVYLTHRGIFSKEKIVIVPPKKYVDSIELPFSLVSINGQELPMIDSLRHFETLQRRKSRLLNWAKQYQAEVSDMLVVSPLTIREQELRGYNLDAVERVKRNCALLSNLEPEDWIKPKNTKLMPCEPMNLAIDTATGLIFQSSKISSGKINERDAALLLYQFVKIDILPKYGNHIPFSAIILEQESILSVDAKAVIRGTVMVLVGRPLAEIKDKLKDEPQNKQVLEEVQKALSNVLKSTAF